MIRARLAAGLVALTLLAPATARAQDGPFGTVARVDSQGAPYVLTAEDALWSARMLVGEAGGQDDQDNAAVLWSMLNSYMLRPVRKDYPTFHAFIRAYCTPLQPWLKSSGALDRHKKKGTPLVEVEPGKFQLKRHVELQERAWTKLPATARALVERVFAGKLPSPCRNATQFCSTAVYFHDKHGRSPTEDEHATYTQEYAKGKKWTWVKVAGANPKENCFFEEERFASLPKDVVKVQAAAAKP